MSGDFPRGRAEERPPWRTSSADRRPDQRCILERIHVETSKTIRVEEDTHAALEALKGEDETFDELLTRLIEERRETVTEGAGLWAGSDAAELARAARREMKRGVGSR